MKGIHIFETNGADLGFEIITKSRLLEARRGYWYDDSCIDFAFYHHHPSDKNVPPRNFLQSFRGLFEGNCGTEWSRAECEAFFDDRNFDI